MDGPQYGWRSSSVAEASIDPSPLLIGNGNASNHGVDEGSSFSRMRGLAWAARFLRRASSRRLMREPSMLVRETAAAQLEERQSDWAYSRAVVVLDLIWNLAFAIVALVVLVMTKQERPITPLRVWVLGYALQCVLHMVCVCLEYRRRHQQRALAAHGTGPSSSSNLISTEYGTEEEDSSDDSENPSEHISLIKQLESANTTFSFVWWIVGFYWILIGGQALTHDSPHLYWLCIIFLAFDVFFVIFCVALACVVGIAVCCCLPCIIALLYAVADQEGASEEDISSLPKYKFRHIKNIDSGIGEKTGSFGGAIVMISPSETPNERVLRAEDAECCICLSAYDDGIELRELPCNHHFHCACIDKWLRMNATCPLCKFNILKGTNTGREEV